MIVQTAPPGQPRLAIMMYEHTALSHQFARGFGNDEFQGAEPNDLRPVTPERTICTKLRSILPSSMTREKTPAGGHDHRTGAA